MSPEGPYVQRAAAESLAPSTGMTIENALDGLDFQDRAMAVLDDVEEALSAVSGDQWFDWSDGRGRLKIGVTTRADPAELEAGERILKEHGLAERADFVKVVWTIRELEGAQDRVREALKPLPLPWGTGLEPSTNSISIHVTAHLDGEQLEVVEAAVRAAGVSVQVCTDAGWGQLDAGGSKQLKVSRPNRPVWFPIGERRLDARRLLGLREDEAVQTAASSGCIIRVVNRGTGISLDFCGNRIDVIIEQGIVVALDQQ